MTTKREITDWLSSFEIVLSSASTSVFNNSRQQVEIIILAKPISGQVISDNEFKSLRIVSQKVIGIYDPLPEKHVSAPWFYSDQHDERFDYFPALTPPALPELPPPPGMDEKNLIREGNASYWLNDNEIRYKQLYIHSRAPAGSKVTLRVAITKDADGGGKGEDYYSDDPLESSIDLYAHPAPNYTFPQDYQWTQTRSEGDTVGGSRFIHEHSLSPIEVPFSYAEFESGDTKGMIRWQDHQPDQTFASHVGIALPGNKTVHYDTGIRLGAQFPERQVKEVKSDNAGAIIVLLQGDNQILYYTAGTDHQGPCQVSAYDRHGNRHHLTIAFDVTQPDALGRRTKLTVVNTSTLDEQATPSRVANIAFFQVKGIGSPNDNTICRLHNSGMQPTFIDVVIRALDDNQQPVKLTSEELNKIALVRYDTGALLGSQYSTYIAEDRRFPDNLFDVLGLVQKVPARRSCYVENRLGMRICNQQTRLLRLFSLFLIAARRLFVQTLDTKISVLPETLQSDQAVKFWIKTNATSNLQVAARLVIGGVTYHTHQKELPPGGSTVAGKSNSSATLASLSRSYELPPSSFSYGRMDVYTSGGKDIDLYRLWVTNSSYRLCFSNGATTSLHYRKYTDKKQRIQQHYRLDNKRFVKVSPHHELTAEINAIRGNAYASRLLTSDEHNLEYVDIAFQTTYYDQNGYGWPMWIANTTGSFGNTLHWGGATFIGTIP